MWLFFEILFGCLVPLRVPSLSVSGSIAPLQRLVGRCAATRVDVLSRQRNSARELFPA